MKTETSTATAGGHTPTRHELTFDGIGINGPDQYRTRVATLNGDANAHKYGPIFSQAPAMLEALKARRDDLEVFEIIKPYGKGVMTEKERVELANIRAIIASVEVSK